MHKIFVLLLKELKNELKPAPIAYLIYTFCIVLPVNLHVPVLTQNTKNLEREIILEPQKFDKRCLNVTYPFEFLAYEPSSPFLQNLMERVACFTGYDKNNIKIGFKQKFQFGFEFKGVTIDQDYPPESLDYIIYPTEKDSSHISDLWMGYNHDAKDLMPTYEAMPYYPNISRFQIVIDRLFLEMNNISDIKTIVMDSQSHFLYPKLRSRMHHLAALIALWFLYFAGSAQFLEIIMQEKLSGITEFLKIMGYGKSLQRLALFLGSLLFYFLTGLIFILILFYAPLHKDSVVYRHVSPAFMTGYYILSTINILTFTYLFSFLFQNEFKVMLMFSVYWGLAFTLIFAMMFATTWKIPNYIEALLNIFAPPLSMWKSFFLLSDFEFYGKSVKMNEKLSPDGNILTIGQRLLTCLISIFLCIFLGIYFENILPGKYGVRLPLGYCFKKSYWSKRKVKEFDTQEKVMQNPEFFETPSGSPYGISVKNLSKIYDSKSKGAVLAVNNLSIDFVEGEITGLLGHNGAGKTTLISIIIGMITPSSGIVLFKNENPNCDWKINVGYCPQEGIFLENFSAFKNLVFFGMAKNQSKKDAETNAYYLLRKFNLLEIKRKNAKSLSGGQRKKLSLAIALTGNPKVLILDEPSTGIDISIRREIWDLLLELRGSKTIILSTHLMEEADAICDRVAVLAYGELKCFGSPLFLKSRFGTGYSFSAVAANIGKIKVITDLVKKYVKGANLKYQNFLTLAYELPESELAAFPDLFEAMDARKRDGEITSYNVSVSTMEDVFLRIDNMLKEEYRKANKSNIETATSNINAEEYFPEKLTGASLICNRILALLIKNFIYLRRNWMTFSLACVLIISMNVLLQALSQSKSPSSDALLPYDLRIYGETEILYSNTASAENDSIFVSFRIMMDRAGFKYHKVQNITAEITELHQEDFHKYTKTVLAFEFSKHKVTVLHNREAIHAFSIAINLLNNLYLINTTSFIKTSLSLKYLKREAEIIQALTCPMTVYTIPLQISFERMLFIIRPLAERKLNVKIYQLMITSPGVYWLSNIIFDLFFYMLYCIIYFPIYLYLNPNLQDFVLNNIGRMFANLLLTLINVLILGYVITAVTASFVKASMIIMVFLFLSFITSFLPILSPKGFDAMKYLTPNGPWMSDLNYICWDKSGTQLHSHIFYFLAVTLILFIVESRILQKIYHKFWTWFLSVDFELPYNKDPSVEKEEQVVKNLLKSQLGSKTLVVDNVKRWFAICCKPSESCSCSFPAVKGVSFTIDKAECFGLVGKNGAGKSTIFNILTGVLVPSYGETYLKGVSIGNYCLNRKALSEMGYCSQSGNYLPDFKGKEMLQLFARLKGLKGSDLEKEVRMRLTQVSLEEYKNKQCKTYSGGTLRKLASALAVIGNPMISLMDEPTSGVDPVSRRSIWTLVNQFRESGHSILLTSHSMDECEVLCTRLAMITKGRLRCVGEATQIKDLFGENYLVTLKMNVKASEINVLELKVAVQEVFKLGWLLLSENLTILRYQIKKETTWKKLFSELNLIKSKFKFLEYFSATSVSLEEIFLQFNDDDDNNDL